MPILITTLELTLIFLPVLIALLLVFFVYLFGNVYNGLVRRREKVRSSWHELKKVLVKFYELLPSILQHSTDDDVKNRLRELYQSYKGLNLEASSSELAALDAEVSELVAAIPSGAQDKFLRESSDFAAEYRRILRFSIPLYNANVRDYNHFRRMFVNRLMARIFHFGPAEYFLSPAALDKFKKELK